MISLYKSTHLLLSPIFKLWIRRVDGIHNIPKSGAAIIALNHESYLDFLCFSSVCPREIHFLAAEKFFDNPLWLPLMRVTQQIQVDRFSGDKSKSISQALNILERGTLLGIFPEGTRSSTGKLQIAFPGVVELALKAKVPIVPVGIVGSFDVWPRNNNFPKFKRDVEIRIGSPIHLNYLFQRVQTKALSYQITHSYIMHKIAELTNESYSFSPKHTFHFLGSTTSANLVFFDVDNTLVNCQSQFEFVRYLTKKKKIPKSKFFSIGFLFLLYKYHLLPRTESFRKVAFKIIKNWYLNDAQKIVEEFFNQVLKKKILQDATEKIKEHQDKGDIVILFSTAWDKILEPLRSYLGIRHLVATHVKIVDGKFSGEIKGTSPHGYDKVIEAQKFLNQYNFDIRKTCAYADHYSDVDLLNFVKSPFVVNPDKKLRQVATYNGWPIYIWEKEIRDV